MLDNKVFDHGFCTVVTEDVPGPEGRLISTEERMQSLQQSQEDVEQDTEGRLGRLFCSDLPLSRGCISILGY